MALWRALTEAGWCDLSYLDESGFAPTLPTGSTWARAGTRALVGGEPPRGRRLSVLGAVAPFGTAARLVGTDPAGKVDGATLLAFVRHGVAGLPAEEAAEASRSAPAPRRDRPCVVVLDNASAHVSKVVQAARPALEAANVWLYCLPPYSPELNRIEALWRQVKYQDLPARGDRTLDDRRAAVEGALHAHATRLLDETTDLPAAA